MCLILVVKVLTSFLYSAYFLHPYNWLELFSAHAQTFSHFIVWPVDEQYQVKARDAIRRKRWLGVRKLDLPVAEPVYIGNMAWTLGLIGDAIASVGIGSDRGRYSRLRLRYLSISGAQTLSTWRFGVNCNVIGYNRRSPIKYLKMKLLTVIP